MRWFRHLVRMPHERLSGEVFGAHATVSKYPGHATGTISLGWPGNASGYHRKSWMKWPGRGTSGRLCSADPRGERYMHGYLHNGHQSAHF